MANSIVTSLPQWVDEQKLPLIAKSVLGAESAQLFNLQTGVKSKTAINTLSTEIAFGDGSECAFSASGAQTLSQRYIEPAYLKVNMEYCDKNLLDTWAGYQVKIAADPKALPFEEMFTSEVVNHVAEAVEKMVWQGDSENVAGKVEFDGILKVLSDASASVIPVTFGTGSTAYAKVKDMLKAMPETVKAADDAVIFVGKDDYEEYMQDLVAANLYYYNPGDGANEYKVPGSTISVKAVNGLNGTHKMVAGRKSNFYYGTDMQNDQEAFDLWYSKDDRVFKLAIEFMAGTQVAFPDEIVLGA